MQEYIRGYQVTVIPSGAHGWFDFYINGKPWGCCRGRDLSKRIEQVIDLKEAAYQPQNVLDAITNALGSGGSTPEIDVATVQHHPQNQ